MFWQSCTVIIDNIDNEWINHSGKYKEVDIGVDVHRKWS